MAAGLLGSLAVAALVLLAAPGRRAGADEEVARFLLDRAKDDIAHRDWDEAAQRLLRARDEDPDLLEAAYLLGTVHEKRDEPAEALAAYRAFRDGCAAREREGDLDRDLERQLRRAERRIEVLGRGERELESLNEEFAESILAFARKHRLEDPDIAAHALERLLAVRPEHEAARELHDDIVGATRRALDSDVVDPAAQPIPGIRRWDDLLERRALEATAEVDYEDGLATIDQRGGSIFWLDGKTTAPDVFLYELEFRVREVYDPSWAMGFVVGRPRDASPSDGLDAAMAFAQRSLALLVRATGTGNQDLADAVIEPIETGRWVRLTLAVEGRKMKLFLDGDHAVTSSVPGRRDLAGVVGLFHQRCVVDIRLLRLGTR